MLHFDTLYIAMCINIDEYPYILYTSQSCWPSGKHLLLSLVGWKTWKKDASVDVYGNHCAIHSINAVSAGSKSSMSHIHTGKTKGAITDVICDMGSLAYFGMVTKR